MEKSEKSRSLAGKISIVSILMVVLSTAVVGVFSYYLYRSDSISAHAANAESIAKSVASAFHPADIQAALAAKEKNPHWKDMKDFVDRTKTQTGVTYLYVVGSHYSDKVEYILEGVKPGEADTCQLGDTDPVNAFAEEMYTSLKTGMPTVTNVYDSVGYGLMVSGFAPILDAAGQPVGVVGVDIAVDDVMSATNSFGLKLVLIVLAFIALFGIISMRYVRRHVGVPIAGLTRVADQVAMGDMSADIRIDSDDEIGRLAESFKNLLENNKKQVSVLETLADKVLTDEIPLRCENDAMNLSLRRTIDNLNQTFSEIQSSTGQVSTGARQIANSAQSLAQGSTEQAAAVEQLSKTISDVAEKTKGNANLAEQAAALAGTIKNNAEKGAHQMSQMMQAVREINEASQSIGKVIKVIDDIAFQTNILALNAAVEAARAGQHGKGFAVVAEEVRNLAGKSAEAAKDTGELINNSIEKAELGARIAHETAASLSDIVAGINESGQIVGDIAKSSSRQSVAIFEINKGIEQIAQVIQLNSATAEESAAASEEMSGQSAMLLDLVSQFRLKEESRGTPYDYNRGDSALSDR